MTQNNATQSIKNQPSILWHDYETWGINPKFDKPSQFAGIRTDLDLNIIGEPEMFFCQPPIDYLPQPEACLVTGITPQKAQRQGLSEASLRLVYICYLLSPIPVLLAIIIFALMMR
jgi:exodeoxyribonuclease-1